MPRRQRFGRDDASDEIELLFLHALPLDGSMWHEQTRRWPAASHAPTLYGLGDNVVDWAGAALNLPKGNRVVVVGNSIGGSCAIETAMLAPDRIAALVLVGTKAGHDPDPGQHTQVLECLATGGVAAAWEKYWSPMLSRTADGGAPAWARKIAMRQPAEAVACGVTAFHTRPDRRAALGRLTCPVVFVSGEDDPAPGVERCRSQAQAVPNGQLVVVPGCGHYVPIEKPDRLNSLLEDLLHRVTRSGRAEC